MNIKMISLATFAFVTISGSAFASNATPEDTLNDSTKMAPFYTDTTMTTRKSDEEFKAALHAMSKEDREAVIKGCSDKEIAKKHDDFCSTALKLGAE